MRKYVYFIVVFCWFGVNGFGQTPPKIRPKPKKPKVLKPDEILRQKIENSPWLVEPEYSDILPISDNTYYLKNGDSYIFINSKNTILYTLKTEYHILKKFGNNLFLVRSKNDYWRTKYGLINKSGKVILPIEYDRIGSLIEGLAIVEKDRKYGFIDINGKLISTAKYQWVSNFSNGVAIVNDSLEGLIDRKGNIIMPLKYHWINEFSDGFAVVQKYYKRNGEYSYIKTGLINLTGQEVIPLGKYRDIKDFSDGLALVNGSSFFIDKTLKEVIPSMNSRYSYVYSFKNGLAIVRSKNDYKYGCINKNGREVISTKYEEIKDFSQGLLKVRKENYKWGYIDKQGKIIVPIIYDEVLPFIENIALVRKDRNWGVVDIDGKEIFPTDYDELRPFCDGVSIARKKKEWRILTKDGQETIIPKDYYQIRNFSEDRAAVIGIPNKTQKDNNYSESDFCDKLKCGFIDKTGKLVIPLKYDVVNSFSGGIATIQTRSTGQFIDKTGEVVIPLINESTLVNFRNINYCRGHNSGYGDATSGRNKFRRRGSVEFKPINSYKKKSTNNFIVAKVRISIFGEKKYGILYNPLLPSPFTTKLYWKTPDQDIYDTNIPYGITKNQAITLRVETDQKLTFSNFYIYIEGKTQPTPKSSEVLKLISEKHGKYTYLFNYPINFEERGEGSYTIKVKVKDGARVLGESSKMRFDYRNNQKLEKVKLEVVSVGSPYDLDYTTNDANAICPIFSKQEGKLFSEVNCTTIVGDEVTGANVIKTLRKTRAYFNLQRDFKASDVLLIFISSHGGYIKYNDGNDSTYVFPMSDYEGTAPEYTTLRLDLIFNLFKDVNCKKVLLIDACHSGQGLKKSDKSNAEIPDYVSAKAFQTLLKEQKGWYFISSSSAGEKSWESDNLEHGTFTYGIIEALKEGKADLNNDGIIYLLELYQYLKERVPEINIADGLKEQNPEQFTNIDNFAIYKK